MRDEQQKNDVERLARLVEKIQFAMMTTVNPADGSLRSRPMTLLKTDFDGNFWFFTGRQSALAVDIQSDGTVNLAFADPGSSRYVSVSGSAELVDDPEKAKELWNPIYKAWFPKGLDDQELALLKVSVHSADFWETPSSKVTQLYGFAKAALTGKRPGREIAGRGHLET